MARIIHNLAQLETGTMFEQEEDNQISHKSDKEEQSKLGPAEEPLLEISELLEPTKAKIVEEANLNFSKSKSNEMEDQSENRDQELSKNQDLFSCIPVEVPLFQLPESASTAAMPNESACIENVTNDFSNDAAVESPLYQISSYLKTETMIAEQENRTYSKCSQATEENQFGSPENTNGKNLELIVPPASAPLHLALDSVATAKLLSDNLQCVKPNKVKMNHGNSNSFSCNSKYTKDQMVPTFLEIPLSSTRKGTTVFIPEQDNRKSSICSSKSDPGEDQFGKSDLCNDEDKHGLLLSTPAEISLNKKSDSIGKESQAQKDSVTPPTINLTLREWSPMNFVVSLIPPQARKKSDMSFLDLKLTCLAAVEQFLVLGTNVGLIYWYDRKLNILDRFKTQNPDSSISVVSVISSVDYMVAAGNADGQVTIFKIPKLHFTSGLPINNNRTDNFDRESTGKEFSVTDLHTGKISTLEWSGNGMKLFSGDVDGTVVMTDIDYVKDEAKSKKLLKESGEIVQLSYAKKHLLICLPLRAIVHSLATNFSQKVGTLDRKIGEPFGGIFCKSSYNEELKLYSARPGGRLWLATCNGKVENTINFHLLRPLENRHLQIPVINPNSTNRKIQKFRMGILRPFMKTYLTTYSDGIIYVLDPVNAAVVGLCQELRTVIDLAVNESEIFVLESDRTIVRLSNVPDQFYPPKSKEFLSKMGMADMMNNSMVDFKEPFNFLTNKLKQSSRVLPIINNSLLNAFKNVIGDGPVEEGQFPVVTPFTPYKDADIPNVVLEDSSLYVVGQEQTENSTQVEDKFKHISEQPFEDVLLRPVRRKRKNRLQKKNLIKHSTGDAISLVSQSDAVSLSSAYSTNSDGEATIEVHRRNSSQSDSAQSSQSTSTTFETSKELVQDSKIIPHIMSNSWSIGQSINPNLEISLQDLETKEEILARKLNWPELLPEYAKCTFNDQNSSTKNYFNLEQGGAYQNYFGEIDKTCRKMSDGDEEFDENSSISTLKAARSGDIDNCESNSASALSMSSSVSIPTVEGEKDNAKDETINSEEETRTNMFEDSIDIYTKYAPRDDSQSGSLTSALSFGPPSGSSAVGGSGSRSGGESSLEPKIVEVCEESSFQAGSSVNCSLEVRDMVVEPMVKENDSWISYKVPASLQSIAACESYVVCTDTKNNIYYSRYDVLSLRWIQAPCQASKLAISPCGSVLWRLYRGTLYSLMNPTTESPTAIHNGEWSKLCTEVISMDVNQNIGWIVKADGSVHICRGALESAIIPEFKKVSCQWPISQLKMVENIAWAVTVDGRLIYHEVTETFSDCSDKVDWKEKKFEAEILSITTLCSGPCNTIWFADASKNIFFLSDMLDCKFGGNSYPWKVNFGEYALYNVSSDGSRGSATSTPFSHGSWKSRISGSLSFQSDRISSLLSSKPPVLSGTSSTIWYAASGSSTLNVSKRFAEGHRWTTIKLNRVGRACAWNSVCAGSICMEHGYLWLLDSKGKLFYTKPETGDLKALDLPCASKLLCIIPTLHALWVLNSDGIIYTRCNISPNNSIGYGWEKIDFSVLANVHFIYIACGSAVAWACDKQGKIYMRIGSLQPPGPTDITPVWMLVDDSTEIIKNYVFTKVYVGSNDSMVWALDKDNNIYVREAVYPDLLMGVRWLLVSGIEATMLDISDNAVWALSPKGEIFRRCGISSTNFVGDYWKKVPGSAKLLTVSLLDEIWALDTYGQLVKHSQETLNFKEKKTRLKPKAVLDKEDEDWVLVDSVY